MQCVMQTTMAISILTANSKTCAMKIQVVHGLYTFLKAFDSLVSRSTMYFVIIYCYEMMIDNFAKCIIMSCIILIEAMEHYSVI